MTLTPSPSGRPEIHEQQIGLVTARLDLAACGGLSLDDTVVLGLQQHAQHVANGRIVLDHEDLVHRLRHAGGARVGNVNSKRAPPPGRSPARISPPCARTIARQIASPRPAPTIVPSSEPR